MKQCVFIGPTMPAGQVPPEFDVYGPAMMGAVYLAVEAAYERIAIVDGLFGNVPSVWHKEILYALSRNVEVVGAASMGALRAVEMRPYGMSGMGLVYRLFRRGILTDDDEVAVAHGPAEIAYAPVSESMVNIRYLINRLRKKRIIAECVARAAVDHMKSMYFLDRHLGAISDFLRDQATLRDAEQVVSDYFVDIKRRDARLVLAEYRRRPIEQPRSRLWRFATTEYWSLQMDEMRLDLPPLAEQRVR